MSKANKSTNRNKPIKFFEQNIGMSVTKISGKPFKSRKKENKVIGLDFNKFGIPVYKFQDDDSEVECFRCEPSI